MFFERPEVKLFKRCSGSSNGGLTSCPMMRYIADTIDADFLNSLHARGWRLRISDYTKIA